MFMFMRDIGLSFSFFVLSLCDFSIRVMPASENKELLPLLFSGKVGVKLVMLSLNVW